MSAEIKHVAIIMDGNGRWAKKRGLPRVIGHRQGVESVREAVKVSKDLGIDCVGTIANKITEPAQMEVIKSQLKDTALLGTLGYSRSLQEADLRRTAVFGADAEVTEQLKQAKDKLVELIAESSSKSTKQ